MTYTSDYPFVYLTSDVVLLAVRPGEGLSVLVVKRGNPPYQGRWALPGGFVDEREDVERAARRELREETGVAGRWLRLMPLPPFTAPRRDPRHRTVSVPFLGLSGPDVKARAGDDAAEVTWLPVADALTARRGARRLAFDHAEILATAVDLLCARMEATAIALRLLPERFTVAELREVYEEVWGRTLDPGNFQRKVTSVPDLLRDTGELATGGRGRPAALFRAGTANEIWPPLSRDRDR